jgi:hypothetical protein
MTFQDPSHVADVLSGVLDGLSAALTAGGRPMERVGRFYGPPVWDCEQLVAWPSTRVGKVGTSTDSNILQCAFKQVLDVNLLLLRCFQVLNDTEDGIPPIEVVDADGTAFATDMWIMQRTITVGAKDGTLFPSTTCQEVRVNPITPLPPQSGLYGMSTRIEVTL